MTNPQDTWVVLPAGGKGERFTSTEDKLLQSIGGIPLLIRTLLTLLKATHVTGAVVACRLEQQTHYQQLLKPYSPTKRILWVEGGATRRDSVYQGLLALPEEATLVAIHDAARPFINPQLVDTAIELVAQGNPGVVVATPMIDTVKQTSAVHPLAIEQTVDRTHLWRAQTPQIFQKALILKAHQAIHKNTPITDDAQLLEQAGLGPVLILPGEGQNIKITFPEDALIAEALLKAGLGF